MAVGLTVLVTSPRVAAGLLSWPAWRALHAADEVWAARPDEPGPAAVRAAGIEVGALPVGSGPAELTARAVTRAVVWLAGADDEIPADATVVVGSTDLPGARVLDLVAVMDRLRSPGGCPWDAQQTHESLLPYLLEETYETVESVETGDLDDLREELGDLLLQVVFHARLGEEHPDRAWSLDDVAAGIVAKLVARHPHVFGDEHAPTAEHVEANWEAIKRAEKGRRSAVDGVPLAQPALALADALLARAQRAEVVAPVPSADVEIGGHEQLGELLLAIVAAARAHGLDAEAALRESARRFAGRVRAAEAGPSAGADSRPE